MKTFVNTVRSIDWILMGSVFVVAVLGLVTMYSFSGENQFFERQVIWLSISFAVFFVLSTMDFQFLRRTGVVMTIYLGAIALLLLLLATGSEIQGAQRWLEIGGFTFQVSEFAKLAIIIVLAKYFTRRHVEIRHIRHIIVSGVYAFILFALIFLQPDFGSSVVIAIIWLGMVMVSGISNKHLGLVALAGLVAFAGLWFFAFEPYQKERIVSFVQPYADTSAGGYHVHQSTIAIGSGRLMGKGIGYGTQSSLQFLPEHETDFIFAAYAEEWGFVGVLLLFFLYGVIVWRILYNAMYGATNFETLFGVGVALVLITHIFIHVGANVDLLPVTGITLPFMSFGGSHLIILFIMLGILAGMRKYNRVLHKAHITQETLFN